MVALQEVDNKTKRAKKLNLVTELAKLTDMNGLFGRTMYFNQGEYGVGILSKYSFSSTQNKPLFSTKGKEPRTGLEAVVNINKNKTVRLVATHLDHTQKNTNRIKQAEQLNNRYGNSEIPTIIAGDLNAKPDSKTLSVFSKNWKQSFQNTDYTHSSTNPHIKIDYILYQSKQNWQVVNTKVICDETASDHCAILSVFVID